MVGGAGAAAPPYGCSTWHRRPSSRRATRQVPRPRRRRLAARGRGADRRGARQPWTARSSPIRRATWSRRAASSVDGRALQGPEPRVVYAVNKPVGVVSTARDTHGRPTVIALVAAPGLRLYPVGRLDVDSSRPDPADQRRRAREPADAPALRGAEDLPRPRRRRARRAARAARLRDGVELEDGPHGARTGARASRRDRARADDPRGPQPPGAADVRGGRPSRCSARARRASARCALGGLAPGAHRRADATPRSSACGAAHALTQSPPCDCSPCAAPSASSATTPHEILARHDRADARRSWSATSSSPRRRQLHLHRHQRPRRRVPRRRGAGASASTACRCCARGRSPCRGRCRG